MSANNEDEMNEAREARKRAEEMLADVKAQEPVIKDLSDRASWLLVQNSFSALVTQSYRSMA
jgi:hypothetical protein